MSIAVIKTGGKQYKVAEGDIVDIELLRPNIKYPIRQAQGRQKSKTQTKDTKIAKAQKLEFEDILDGKKVSAEIIEQDVKGPKINILKFKNKTRYIKRKGHRQRYTKIRIKAIK